MTYDDMFRLHEPQPEHCRACLVMPENIRALADALTGAGYYTRLERTGGWSTTLTVGQLDHQKPDAAQPALVWEVTVEPGQVLIEGTPMSVMQPNEFRRAWRKHLGVGIDYGSLQ
jgi:hypothetical protein